MTVDSRDPSEKPLLLGVINDVSISQTRWSAEREFAIDHLMEDLIQGADRGFIVAVDDKVMLRAEMKRGNSGLRYAFLPTEGLDALHYLSEGIHHVGCRARSSVRLLPRVPDVGGIGSRRLCSLFCRCRRALRPRSRS